MNVKLTNRDKIKIINSDDVFRIMQNVLNRENKIDRDKEHFWIVGMNGDDKILFIELVSIGGVRSNTIEPMTVYRVGVLKAAVKVIFVHNHPSESLRPSEEDKDVTDRLIQVGIILGIEAIDHLIITVTSFYSFDDSGLFEELKRSNQWVPHYELKKKIIKEQEKILKEAIKAAELRGIEKGEEVGRLEGKKEGLLDGIGKGLEQGKIEGELNKAISMAKGLKERGVALEIIAETSGLSEYKIDQL